MLLSLLLTTAYFYSCYEGDGYQQPECEANPTAANKVVILGSGPNRIGQGIEFDYTCTHAATSLRALGYETIMINCNPETVSTDYDTASRLYFEPLTLEDVSEVIYREQQSGKLIGVLVSIGGQTPLKLCQNLSALGFPIAGTQPESIDLAEDRQAFKALLQRLNIAQPDNAICHDMSAIGSTIVEQVGYPVVVRPSNVLGGRAMATLRNSDELAEYLANNKNFLADGAILLDKFLSRAIEVDVDAICDGNDVYIAGIMEHIEHAGVHSGDSACVMPTVTLSDAIVAQLRDQSITIAKALAVKGLINIQYAIKDDQIYVIEANPRASRSVPYVAKATGVDVAGIACRVMLGESLATFGLTPYKLAHYAVKDVVFPFGKFREVDIKLRPEMQSTGEVMGIDSDPDIAFYKAGLACGYDIAAIANIYVNCDEEYLAEIGQLLQQLPSVNIFVVHEQHAQVIAGSQLVNVASVQERIKTGALDFIIDVHAVGSDARAIRQLSFAHGVGYATTVEFTKFIVSCYHKLRTSPQLVAQALSAYH